jgi:DNA polymerase bacteriophage-type
MKNVVIDFESYYDKEINVVDQGVPNYVRDTDAYIVSVEIEGEAAMCGTLKELEEVCTNLAADATVRPIAANSNFDQALWEKYNKPFKLPWHCVLDQSVFHQFPRNLGGLAKCALGRPVDKSMRDKMKGVRYETMPEKEQLAMQNYCLNDAEVEAECFRKLGPMSAFEERVALHTRLQSRRGVFIDTELVDRDKTRISAMRFEAFKAIPWHADAKPLSYPQLVKYCAKMGIPVPKSTAKTDEACEEMMTDHPLLSEVIGNMRRFRRANTLLTKVESLLARVTDAGILPLEMLYCGAPHTRRWSSKGFNIQNLDKEPLVVNPIAVKGGAAPETVWSRNWVKPRPGKIFYCVDYAQIEPRVLNWLVRNEEMMEALRHGFSYYEAYLRSIKQEKRVGWSGQAGTLKKEVGVAKYTKVKNESLGCGYGMGADRYTGYAQVEMDEAKQVIQTFRACNPKITAFWKRLDSIIASAARDKTKSFSIDLPSGDTLQYFNVRPKSGGGMEGYVTKTDFGYQSHQPRLWGGTLTENVTQRTARDIMAHAIVNLEAAGFPVVFSVHDEVILELDDDAGKDDAVREAEIILKTPPEWAADLPLGTEGSFATAYTK